MAEKKISRIARILSIYHLFLYCEEVSIKEITDQMPEVNPATAKRDIALLNRAGVLQSKYSRKANAYIPVGTEIVEVTLPESKNDRQTIEKLRRLCTLMQELYDYDMEVKPLHIEIYRSLFPNASDKTRERDFDDLKEIGYIVRRELEYFPDEDKEKRCYSLETPNGAYSLPTFHEREW